MQKIFHRRKNHNNPLPFIPMHSRRVSMLPGYGLPLLPFLPVLRYNSYNHSMNLSYCFGLRLLLTTACISFTLLRLTSNTIHTYTSTACITAYFCIPTYITTVFIGVTVLRLTSATIRTYTSMVYGITAYLCYNLYLYNYVQVYM